MRIAIHQPNFCPYEGFWDKMRAVDLFIIMVHSQFRKGGYESRFQYLGKWYTMRTGRGLDPLLEKRYLYPKEDWLKISNEFPKLDMFQHLISESLVDTNCAIIKEAAEHMGIDTMIMYDFKTDLQGTDRLIDIIGKYGGEEYLSGPSGRDYLEKAKFEDAGIRLDFQEVKGTRALIEMI